MLFFHKALSLKEQERFSVTLFLLLGLLIGSYLALMEVTTVSMFIKSSKQNDFPLAFFLSGLIGMIVAYFYIKLSNWLPLSFHAIYGLVILLISNLFIFYFFRISSSVLPLYLAFLFIPAHYIILLQIFREFFYKIYHPLQIKRWSVKIEIGVSAGVCIILVFLIYYINKDFVSFEYSYLSGSVLLILIGLFVLIFSHTFPINTITDNVQYIDTYNSYFKLLRNPYSRSIIVYAFLSGFTFGLIDLILYSILADRYETTNEIAWYFSILFIVAVIIGYTLSLFFYFILNNSYSNKVKIFLLPSVLLASSLLYMITHHYYGYQKDEDSFYLLFMIAGGSKIFCAAIHKGFESTVFRNYFTPIELELRYNFQAKAESFFRQSGYLITGVISFITLFIFEKHFSDLSYILVLSILAWLFVTFNLDKKYYTTLKNFLKADIERNNAVNENNTYSNSSSHSIDQLEASAIPLHLNILSARDPEQLKKVIKNLLYSEDAFIQRIALHQIIKYCMLETIEVLEHLQQLQNFPLTKNRDLILSIITKLKEISSRLNKSNYVEQLIHSGLIQEKRLGAFLISQCDHSVRINLLKKLFSDHDFQVRYNAISNASGTDNKEIRNYLIQKLNEPKYSIVALEAIMKEGDKLFPFLEHTFSLTDQTEKVQQMIIKIYLKSENKKSIPLLIKKLNFENKTLAYCVVDVLSYFNVTLEEETKRMIRRELEETCQSIVWDMSAYCVLTSHSTSDILLAAIKSEIDENYISVFKLLSILYDPKTVWQIKENIDSTNIHKKEFSFQLLEALIPEEYKTMLLPILSKESYEITIKKSSAYFIIASINSTELLYDLILRDYKWINRWTKACALKELAMSGNYTNTDIFISNLSNPDQMLQEVAVNILNSIEGSGHEISATKFEQISLLKNNEIFKGIPFTILAEMIKDSSFIRHKAGDTLARHDIPENGDCYLVKEGLIELKINGQFVSQFSKGNFIHFLNFIYDPGIPSLTLEAKENCMVYKIPRENFNELIFLYEEISNTILKNS